MPMWRYAVITFLREPARVGVLDTDMSRSALQKLLTSQYERWWNIDIRRFRSKKQFLGYAGVILTAVVGPMSNRIRSADDHPGG